MQPTTVMNQREESLERTSFVFVGAIQQLQHARFVPTIWQLFSHILVTYSDTDVLTFPGISFFVHNMGLQKTCDTICTDLISKCLSTLSNEKYMLNTYRKLSQKVKGSSLLYTNNKYYQYLLIILVKAPRYVCIQHVHVYLREMKTF